MWKPRTGRWEGEWLTLWKERDVSAQQPLFGSQPLGNPADSHRAAALGLLLAAPHLQEVQHILGQFLIVAQDTLELGQGGCGHSWGTDATASPLCLTWM